MTIIYWPNLFDFCRTIFKMHSFQVAPSMDLWKSALHGHQNGCGLSFSDHITATFDDPCLAQLILKTSRSSASYSLPHCLLHLFVKVVVMCCRSFHITASFDEQLACLCLQVLHLKRFHGISSFFFFLSYRYL